MNIIKRAALIGVATLTIGGVAAVITAAPVSAWGNGHICYKGVTHSFDNEHDYYAFLNAHKSAVEGDCVVAETTTTAVAPTTTVVTTAPPTTVVIPTTVVTPTTDAVVPTTVAAPVTTVAVVANGDECIGINPATGFGTTRGGLGSDGNQWGVVQCGTAIAVVASDTGAVPPAAAAAAPAVVATSTSLPATGSDTGLTLGLAAAVLLIGIGLVTFTRRQPVPADES